MRPVAIADRIAWELLGTDVTAGFARCDIELAVHEFAGEITHAEIARLSALAQEQNADLIIGLGGGKALDAAKAVARLLDIRMASVPTIASNDGPASGAIAVYNDAHVMVEVLQMKRHPDLVLVDTSVIANAPARFFLAGIGDALSKKFEAEACQRAGAQTLYGGVPSIMGMAAAEACYRTLRLYAPAATKDVNAHRTSDAVEAVVEATVLMSTLSFENGGLSIAHAIARGFSHLPRASGSLHGEHVAYGLLVQLVLEKRGDALLTDLMGFYVSIGLPFRLEQFLGSAPSPEEILSLAEFSMTSPSVRRFDTTVNASLLAQAIQQVEGRGK